MIFVQPIAVRVFTERGEWGKPLPDKKGPLTASIFETPPTHKAKVSLRARNDSHTLVCSSESSRLSPIVKVSKNFKPN